MIDLTIIQKSKGNYIRFSGRGIIDGLKERKTKRNFYKIIGVKENGDIILKAYYARGNCYLPNYNHNQNYEIITPEEYKRLLPNEYGTFRR